MIGVAILATLALLSPVLTLALAARLARDAQARRDVAEWRADVAAGQRRFYEGEALNR